MEIMTAIFLLAPIASLLIAYLFFSKSGHDRGHFFHVFSVAYLATLAFREINEIVKHSVWFWLLIILIILGIIFAVRKFIRAKSNWNIFSHHHHREFSYVLGCLFIFHSFVDGLIFGGSGLIQSGLVLHRLIDGFVIFGLLSAGENNSYGFFKKLNLSKFLIVLAFLIAPTAGLYLPDILNFNFWYPLRIIAVFVLAILTILDIQTELTHRHNSPVNRLLIAILLGLVLGLLVMH